MFPSLNVYDCLNIQRPLIGQQRILISGITNPAYRMVIEDIKVMILQPNSRIVLEKITQSSSTPVTIAHKIMDTTITIPNKFRNNTLTYIFEINMDSDLEPGDYFKMEFPGNWTFFLEDCSFI